MSKNRSNPRYVRNIAIVHGKSESIICHYIKSNLRLPLEIYSHNKGKNNIEISSINPILNNNVFNSRSALNKKYIIDPKKSLEIDDLEIFTIMDKDRCSDGDFADYKSKKIFSSHWARDIITPIYNIE